MNKFLSQILTKQAGLIGTAKSMMTSPMAKSLMGGAKNTAVELGGAIKSDAGKLSGQAKTLMSGSKTIRGAGFTTNVKVDRMSTAKDMIKNKALATGVIGGAGAGMLMAGGSKSPTDKINERK